MIGVVVGLLFFQVIDQIRQIDRLAASEPAAFGIDTRIRAAEALRPKYPSIAQREMSDAEAVLPGVSDTDYRDVLRVRIAGLLAGLDFAEAERVAKSIQPERKHDRVQLSEVDLADLSHTKIEEALYGLLKLPGKRREHISARTVRHVAGLSVAPNKAFRLELVPVNPMLRVELPAVQKKDAHSLTPDQIRDLRETCLVIGRLRSWNSHWRLARGGVNCSHSNGPTWTGCRAR